MLTILAILLVIGTVFILAIPQGSVHDVPPAQYKPPIIRQQGANKKPIREAANCAECEQLIYDEGILRCMFYDGAIIEDAEEKQCKDSVYG